MLIQKEHTPVSAVGVGPTTQFTFSNSSKLFTLLSDTLYQDKISAIIRELSCNAADAHVEAKNSGPFEVHTPNSLDPTFRIKDYGTGLSDKDMRSIYACYGESTKSETNDYVGAFGLGSKTPFSYTNSFSIISRYKGIKSLYTAYVDEEGFPSLTQMNSQETDEPDGLEVFFPVKKKHFFEFETKARATLKSFTAPVSLNGSLLKREQRKVVFENENFTVFERDYSTSFHVKMGHVVYPVRTQELFKTKEDTTEKRDFLLAWGIELNVPIGFVEVTVSREDLSYTDYTIKNLLQALGQAAESYETELDNKYRQIQNRYDRAMEISKDFARLQHMISNKWKPLLHPTFDPTKFNCLRVGTLYYGKYKGFMGRGQVLTDKNPVITYKSGGEEATLSLSHYRKLVVFNEQVVLSNLQEFLYEKFGKGASLIISLQYKKTDEDVAKKQLRDFLKIIGDPKVEFLTIPKRTKKCKKKAEAVVYCLQKRRFGEFIWRPVDDYKKAIPEGNKCLFTNLLRNSILWENRPLAAKDNNSIGIRLNELGFTLFGVRKTEKNKIPGELKKLPSLSSFLKDKLIMLQKDKAFKQYVRTTKIACPDFINKLMFCGKDIQDPDIKELIDIFQSSKTSDNIMYFTHIHCLAQLTKIENATSDQDIAYWKQQIHRIRMRYPLLEAVLIYRSDESVCKDLVLYINTKHKELKNA